MPRQYKTKRKTGFNIGDIKKESFRYREDTKAVASPAANYSIPKDTISGDTQAVVATLKNLTSALPGVVKMKQKEGAEASLRGEVRPEGIFSQPNQEGWDYTEAQAMEGQVYTTYDEQLQKLAAKFNGKNPGEFLKAIEKMTKNLDQEFLKDKSDAYLSGIQGTLAKVHRDTALVAQSIIQKKVAENGVAKIKALFTQQLIETEQSGMSDEGKAYKNHGYFREMQKLGREKYGLDNNAVTLAAFQATQPSGRTNPKMYDFLYIKDKDSIAPKDTEGGKGVDAAVFTAQGKFNDNIPTVAYKTLKKMPSLINEDNSFNYIKANDLLADPDNWEALGIETNTQAAEVRTFLNNSRISTDSAKAQVKQEYTTKTLNRAFDMIYKSKTQNTTDAISFIKASDLDGLVKLRVVKGLLTNIKKGDSFKYNTALTEILEGKIKHPETIYKLMGNAGGVTIPEGKELLWFFNNVNSEENANLKASLIEYTRIITKGMTAIDGFSSVVQGAAKRGVMEIRSRAAAVQKTGKDVNWTEIVDQAVRNNKPNRDEQMRSLTEGFSASQRGLDIIEAAGGKFVTIGSGKNSMKATPGLTSFEDFAANLVAWENIRNPLHPISGEGFQAMMADPDNRSKLMQKYEEYNLATITRGSSEELTTSSH